MRWRINQFIFCDQQQTLSSEQQTLQLEPMVVELLAYFCRNVDQIVTREQLIEQVWMGRIITDNAVSKVVTKLRKAFADDVRKPKFIATFPKKGYKFIANISCLEEADYSQPILDKNLNNQSDFSRVNSNTSPDKKYNWRQYLRKPMLLTIALFVVVLIFNRAANEVPKPTTQVKALTRAAGKESQPRMSPDGRYLSFTETRSEKMHLWVKSLKDERLLEISHGSENETWVGPASWNQDGTLVAYLVTTPESCQYFIRTFDQLSVGEAKLIHNCPAGSYGKISFTHDDNRLVYSASEGANSAFSLFEINLSTGVKRRLPQPELVNGGNSQFDLHPMQNKILISSPDKQQWEGFYSLDLDTDELILLFKQDAYICCGIWSHSGDRIVLMGEHPAYQLVSYDLKGKDRQVIYTGGQQIRSPERHINGKDYLFVAGHVNQDVYFYDFKTSSKVILANASVDDRLASFSHHTNEVAYIGLASGNEQVWITKTDAKQSRKLTNFFDNRHYINLLWSYKGDYLIGLALNEIHLINSSTGEFQLLKIPQVEMRGLSFKNNHVVSYSSRFKQGWRVNYYDIKSHKVITEDEQWKYIRYAKKPEDTIWIDQQDNIYVGSNKRLVENSRIKSVDKLINRSFNLKKLGNNWSWLERNQGRYQLMMLNNVSKVESPAQPLLLTDSYHYDLSDIGIIYHTVESRNADIYQSVSD